MKVLVTGAKGMLGQDLCARLETEHEVTAWDVDDLDITDTAAAQEKIGRLSPEMVVHCAAYTHVDGCELDPARAFAVNGLGTWNVASACRAIDAAMTYISTDFVFDGKKGNPYDEFDTPNPISAYGRSKLAGEIFVRRLLARHFIVRSAWLFGAHGRNFVRAIAEHAASENTIKVVSDQTGCPTFTADLSDKVAQIITGPLYGTYHITNSGCCSWAEFAEEILRQVHLSAKVERIRASQWSSPTRRPKDSRLRHLALEMQGLDDLRSWQEALAAYLSIAGHITK